MKLNVVSIAGGLGNQMFQYSFYLNLKCSLYPKECTEIFIATYELHNGFELDKVFDTKINIFKNLAVGICKKYLKGLVLKKGESSIGTFEEIKFVNKMPITYFSGYWQTEKYFLPIEDKIRLAFKFDLKKVNDRTNSLLLEMKPQNAVSIHIRRGDYEYDLNAKEVLGGICDMEFYKKSIHYICEKNKDPFFYIFSDDCEWVMEHFSFLLNSSIVDWNKKADSWQDMMLMSQCKHNIIANSSFSWWGAWLNSNPQKIVIAPSKWFNNFDALDIVPESWIRI